MQDEQRSIDGACHCGQVAVRARLTAAPAAYRPRVCDCDFCCMHAAAWLSDADGALEFTLADKDALRRYRQGAGEAEMLLCACCGVLVGACYDHGDRCFGAVNANIVGEAFGPPVDVSPKRLGADDKVQRWTEVWFRDVRFA